MISTIVFDIGSVLVSFNYADYLKELGLSEEVRAELNIIEDGCPFWRLLDLGYEDEIQGTKNYLRMIPHFKDEGEFAFASMPYYMDEILSTSAFMRAAKEKGYRLLYLSNYSIINWNILWNRFPFFRLFDGGLVSYRAHKIKPHPDIYIQLLEENHITADETLFIDDRDNNIATAAQLGIHTIKFSDQTDLFAESERFGVCCR